MSRLPGPPKLPHEAPAGGLRASSGSSAGSPTLALTWQDAGAVEARLARLTGAETVLPGDRRRALVLDVLAEVWRGAGTGWDREAAETRVSLALPALATVGAQMRALPLIGKLLERVGDNLVRDFSRPLVILSPTALKTPLSYTAAQTHEHNHHLQEQAGGVVACVAYALDERYRMLAAEGPCYVADLAFEVWYQGAEPAEYADRIAAGMASYGARPGTVAHARRWLDTHVDTLRAGACPAMRTLLEAVRVLRSRGHTAVPELPVAG